MQIKADWIKEHQDWRQRDLSKKKYAYFWAVVIIGVTEHGQKELVAVEDGFRESSYSWEELLMYNVNYNFQCAPIIFAG